MILNYHNYQAEKISDIYERLATLEVYLGINYIKQEKIEKPSYYQKVKK